MNQLHFLVIGAHPDDCDLLAAGLALRMRRKGHKVTFVSATDGRAKTLLIRGGERMKEKCTQGYGNAADDEVESYSYDYYFTNDQPLEVTEELFVAFLKDILNAF